MVGSAISLKMMKAEWLSNLLHSKFSGSCVDHKNLRKNIKNVFCIDCNLCFCKHCVTAHCYHSRLQICKYVYHDVVRLQDIQKHFDCSKIQTYKINGDKAIHLNPRPQSKDVDPTKLKNGGAFCEACGRHIHESPNRFCSIACKVGVVVEMSKDESHEMLSPPENDYRKVYSIKEEEESSLSPTDHSSEVIQCSWLSSVSKPKKHLHRRKGVPRRAPLR